MFRSSLPSWRRGLAALLLAFSFAAPAEAVEARSTGVLPAQYSQFTSRSRMIQISLVAVAAGIALLYKK